METYFAPAGRALPEQLARQAAVVRDTPLVQSLMDALPTPVLVLNRNRQAVAANRHLLGMLDVDLAGILGKRPGEIVGCAFRKTGPDGCGTSKHCLTCGAVDAIWTSQNARDQATRECRVTLDKAIEGEAMDLRVTATAVDVGDEPFTVCMLEDISQEKRLAVLSRVFFHDVLNTAGGIQGYAHLLGDELAADQRPTEDLRQLEVLTEQLVQEIQSQRDLMAAESGDLEIDPQPIHVASVLDDLVSLYASHPVAAERTIRRSAAWDGQIISDVRLLARVLGNMLKNALEATPPGGTVTVGCVEKARSVVFSVHNASAMPEETRLQVFHRSFSTKGQPGRGVGTYSMKLLGENYLGGEVDFTSAEPDGTTFAIRLPKVLLPA